MIVSQGMNFNPTIQLFDGVPIASNPNGTPMNWPSGTSARLVLTHATGAYTATWVPTVSTSNMTWNIAAATVDLAPNGSKAQLYVTYGTGAVEVLWHSGGLVRR